MVENKVVLITGGANGIGGATAQLFLENGAEIIILDLDSKGEDLCENWRGQGHKAAFYRCDITSFDNMQDLCHQIAGDHGAIDILINNAGITRDASIRKMMPEQWQQVIDVNLTGVFNCTKAVIPFMIEQEWGRIINTSSVVGLYGNYGQTNYVATKAGVIGMTKTWARELGKFNITVNAVAPGFINTDMVKTVPEQILSMMKDRSALKRLGEVKDVANVYLFLASDMASFITGSTISVDGGLII